MDNKPPIPCVGIVVFRGQDVLMVKRGNPPNAGAWSIPGGRVERGEDFEQAAHRELLEETAVRAEIVGKVTVFETNFGELHYLLHDYAARWLEGEPIAGDDAAEARFMSPDEISELGIWDKTIQVIESARLMLINAKFE